MTLTSALKTSTKIIVLSQILQQSHPLQILQRLVKNRSPLHPQSSPMTSGKSRNNYLHNCAKSWVILTSRCKFLQEASQASRQQQRQLSRFKIGKQVQSHMLKQFMSPKIQILSVLSKRFWVKSPTSQKFLQVIHLTTSCSQTLWRSIIKTLMLLHQLKGCQTRPSAPRSTQPFLP